MARPLDLQSRQPNQSDLRKPLLSLALLLFSNLRKLLLCHIVGSVNLVHWVLRRFIKLLSDLRLDRRQVVALDCQEPFILEFLLSTLPILFPCCVNALLGVTINLGFAVAARDIERVQSIIKTRRVQGRQFAVARIPEVKLVQVKPSRLLLCRLGILGRRSTRRVLLLLGEQRISLCLLARGLGLLGCLVLPVRRGRAQSAPDCNIGNGAP